MAPAGALRAAPLVTAAAVQVRVPARLPRASQMPAIVISIVALVMSAASLTWQIASWKRSGPVVKVTANQSLPIFDHGPDDWYVAVTARNSGRAPVTVTGWGLRFPDGQTYNMMRNLPWSAPLPHRLEAVAEGSWVISTEEVKRECAARGVRHQDLTAFVRLGNGRTVDARRRGIGLA